MGQRNTSAKIVEAAFQLFSEKGYQLVSTKEIATTAGVSEMTLFRHFKNKKELFEEAYRSIVFRPGLMETFEHQLSGDLESDMLKVAQSLQETFAKNKKLILMAIQERLLASNRDIPLFSFPMELKDVLTRYFKTMKTKSVILADPEICAIQFLTAHFGLFMTMSLIPNYTERHTIESLVKEHTAMFIRGLKVSSNTRDIESTP